MTLQSRESIPNQIFAITENCNFSTAFPRPMTTFELKVPYNPDSIWLSAFDMIQTYASYWMQRSIHIFVHMCDIYTGWWFLRSFLKFTNGNSFRGTFFNLFFPPPNYTGFSSTMSDISISATKKLCKTPWKYPLWIWHFDHRHQQNVKSKFIQRWLIYVCAHLKLNRYMYNFLAI